MLKNRFECPVCSGKKFFFTKFSADKIAPHGAECASCRARLSIRSCIPGYLTPRTRMVTQII